MGSRRRCKSRFGVATRKSLGTAALGPHRISYVNLKFLTASAGDAVTPPPKKKKGMGALFAKLSSYTASSSSRTVAGASGNAAAAETPRERLQREMQQYEQLNVEKDAEILIWWKVHEPNFPLLSKLARKYLAVPATSTESERLFSFAGLVTNYLRTCLTGEHAEWLIFLGMNKDFVPKP